MDWKDKAGVGVEADLHKVARVPVQLSKDDTLGSCQCDPYLQQYQMHQDNDKNINENNDSSGHNHSQNMLATSTGAVDDDFQNVVWLMMR